MDVFIFLFSLFCRVHPSLSLAVLLARNIRLQLV